MTQHFQRVMWHYFIKIVLMDFPCGPLGQEDLLEEEMATYSCILAWEIPWTEEPGGLQSMGPPRVGHN